MNQQYPDTLHLAISVSTTSFHFLLQFSSPTPFSHSILAFSPSVFFFRSFSLSVLSHSFFFLPFLSFIFHPIFHSVFHLVFHSVFHSSLFPTHPTNTLKTRTLQRYTSYRLRGIPACFPPIPRVSVSRPSAEHSENKSHTGFPLLQTAGGNLSVCKTVLRFKALRHKSLSRSADYRLRGADTLFRHLPPVSVFRTSAYHFENKSHTGFPPLQTAGGGHQSVKSHLASKH